MTKYICDTCGSLVKYFAGDIKPEDYGKTITYNGKRFKLIGLLPTRRKYPLLVVDLQTDKRMLLPMKALNL